VWQLKGYITFHVCTYAARLREARHVDGRNRLRDSNMNEIIHIVFKNRAALVEQCTNSMQLQRLWVESPLNTSFHVN
jgi:hypothetical protein